MLPALENNPAASYQGPVKIEVLKGAGVGLLNLVGFFNITTQSILLDNDTRLGKPVKYVLLTY